MQARRIAPPLSAMLLAFVSPAGGQSRPAMPIVLPGCTVECCGYGPWVARVGAVARPRPARSPDTAFIVGGGDTVAALTGHVSVTSPGVVAFTSAFTVHAFETSGGGAREARLHLRPGDTLFVIMVDTDAADAVVWHHGRTFVLADGLSVVATRAATTDAPYAVLSLPRMDWWVRVRNRAGRLGWIRNPARFFDVDGCR